MKDRYGKIMKCDAYFFTASQPSLAWTPISSFKFKFLILDCGKTKILAK